MSSQKRIRLQECRNEKPRLFGRGFMFRANRCAKAASGTPNYPARNLCAVLQAGRDLAAVFHELGHHLLVQPDVHLG